MPTCTEYLQMSVDQVAALTDAEKIEYYQCKVNSLTTSQKHLTEIDAINRMLRYIGELPIPSDITIDQLPEGHEAQMARTILKETLREEQEAKYWFNTQEITLLPDTSGVINIPQNIIEFENTAYTKEGGLLYDFKNQTYVFSDPVTLTVRLEIAFDNVPDVFRTFVVLSAAKHLHVYLNGDETTQKELDNKVQLQRIKVERENLKQSKFNLVKGNRLIDRGSNPTAII